MTFLLLALDAFVLVGWLINVIILIRLGVNAIFVLLFGFVLGYFLFFFFLLLL